MKLALLRPPFPRALAVLSLSAAAAFATAPAGADEIAPAASAAMERGMERLAAAEGVHVRFVEHRRVAGLERKLEAPGEIWLAEDGALRWQIGAEPRTLLMVDDQRFYLMENGQVRRGDRRDLGQYERLVQLVGDVFRGDRQRLAAQFDLVHAEPRDDGWVIHLRPRLQPVREAMGDLALAIGADGLPRAWSLRLADGTVLATSFHEVDLDARFPPDFFQSPPEPR